MRKEYKHSTKESHQATGEESRKRGKPSFVDGALWEDLRDPRIESGGVVRVQLSG